MPRGVQFRGSQELQQDVLTSTTMRKADGRDHWIFRFSDSLLLLGGALELIAYLHLGWAGLIDANLEHDPEKHALGLDPMGGYRFPQKIVLQDDG